MAAFLGCGGATTSRTVPRTEVSAKPAGAVVAGSDVNATLGDPISTKDSSPGDPFVARVDDPLVTIDGTVLVTGGSVLRGHVVRVTRGPTPRLDVAFDTIETRDGPVRIRAILVDVGGQGQVITLRMGDPADGGISTSREAIGGGPSAEDERVPELTLPQGTRIRLMLLEPLAPLRRR